MIVHDCWDQDVDHLGQVVLQQVDDFLQRLEGIQVDLAVGLLQPGLEGIKHLTERKPEGEEQKWERDTCW